MYPNDLEPSFIEELVHFAELIKSKPLDDQTGSIESYMHHILSTGPMQEVFPNVAIAVRIYLTLMVSNCSGERSFSALKRVKSVLRSRMNDNKLNNLSLMHIENNVLRKVEFSDIVKTFALNKCRKVFL